MQSVKRTRVSLPTGSWLARQRKLLGKTPADVAQAVHAHIATVRALEQNNRVIPPGWYQDLRILGMHAREPVWPVQLQPYCGADLNDDLRNQVGFQHSRYWLSKQLCVPEHAVNEVIRDNLLVPHSWLLKLAELGANVPGLVRVTLYLNSSRGQLAEPEPARYSAFTNKNGFGSVPSFSEGPAQDAKQAPQKAEAHGQLGHDSRPLESFGPEHVARAPFSGVPSLADSKVSAQAPITASARREQPSVSMNWTEDDGLYFSVSAALLEKIPDGLVDLLNLMTHSGLLGSLPGPGNRASRT